MQTEWPPTFPSPLSFPPPPPPPPPPSSPLLLSLSSASDNPMESVSSSGHALNNIHATRVTELCDQHFNRPHTGSFQQQNKPSSTFTSDRSSHHKNGHPTESGATRSAAAATTTAHQSSPRLLRVASTANRSRPGSEEEEGRAVIARTPQPRQYLTFPARPITRISSRKTKRVPVTSCDVCRLKKLKCNARDQLEGDTCMQCAKSGASCTFEDRDETRKITKRTSVSSTAAAAAAAKVATKMTRSNASNVNTRFLELSRAAAAAAAAANNDNRKKRTNSSVSTGNNDMVLNAPLSSSSRSTDSSGNRKETLVSTQDYIPKGSRTGSSDLIKQMAAQLWPELVNSQAGHDIKTLPSQQRDAAVDTAQQYNNRHAPPYALPSSISSTHKKGGEMDLPWSKWNLPPYVTDPVTGLCREMSSSSLVCMLLDRFHFETSLNTIIVPAAMFSASAFMTDASRESPTTSVRIPSYLLHTMVAIAACSKTLTREPELIVWQSQGWHTATEAVHAQVNITSQHAQEQRQRGVLPDSEVDLHLVQALLLLSINWPGPLERIERINTFDTAVGLATCLRLHDARLLDDAQWTTGGISHFRTQRLALFWSIYCIDKVMAVVFRRAPIIPSDSHEMPMPCLQDIHALLAPSSDDSSGDSENMAAWAQRLILCLIDLAKMLEDVQASLYSPEAASWIKTLDDVYLRITPLEERFNQFTTSNSWLLAAMPTLPIVCRHLAKAVVLQLHLVQLHLYLPALHVSLTEAVVASITAPFTAPKNSSNDARALIATIESAWYLASQPEDGVTRSLTARDAMLLANRSARDKGQQEGLFQYDERLLDEEEQSEQRTIFGFSRACKAIGASLFGLLASSWPGWEGGAGCLLFSAHFSATSSAHVPVEFPITQVSSQSQMQMGTWMPTTTLAAEDPSSLGHQHLRQTTSAASSAIATPVLYGTTLPVVEDEIDPSHDHLHTVSDLAELGLRRAEYRSSDQQASSLQRPLENRTATTNYVDLTADSKRQQQTYGAHDMLMLDPSSYATAFMNSSTSSEVPHMSHSESGVTQMPAWDDSADQRLPSLPQANYNSYTFEPEAKETRPMTSSSSRSLQSQQCQPIPPSTTSSDSNLAGDQDFVDTFHPHRPCSLPPRSNHADEESAAGSVAEEDDRAAEAIMRMRSSFHLNDCVMSSSQQLQQHPHCQEEKFFAHAGEGTEDGVLRMSCRHELEKRKLQQHCSHPNEITQTDLTFSKTPRSATAMTTAFSPHQL